MASMIQSLPATFRKLVVTQMTYKFRDAVEVVTVPMIHPGPKEVMIKTRYIGINASDVNMSAGRYFVQKPSLPYDLGFEGIGEIIQVGPEVYNAKVGQPVAFLNNSAFAEYVCVPESSVFPVPDIQTEYLPLIASGLTAALSLDKAGHIKAGDKVFITAAAGGTGHIAVQWAKNAGCYVIGTCSTPQKAEFLKSIGCDHAINYKEESIEEILKKEYPKGIDVVWETIGGSMFELMLDHLAIRGRLIVLGAITGYKSDNVFPQVKLENLPGKLLFSSTSLNGFLLFHFQKDFAPYYKKLIELVQSKKLRPLVDTGKNTNEGEFVGIDAIPRAVEHLHSGKSVGKVVVSITS